MSDHAFQVPFCEGCGTAGCAASLKARLAELEAQDRQDREHHYCHWRNRAEAAEAERDDLRARLITVEGLWRGGQMDIERLEARIHELEALLDEAREALEPFARFDHDPSDRIRARALLARLTPKESES